MQPALYSLSAFKLARFAARWLPRALARRLAVKVALRVYARRPQAQAALRGNLSALTGIGGAKLDLLCRENVANFAGMLSDYFRCAAGHRSDTLLAQWRGIEHLRAARERGHGVIVVTAHLGHWELGGLLLAQQGLPLTVITLEEPESELTRWRDAYRQHAGLKTITVGPGHAFSFVEIVQALRRNELVAMLVDRPYAGTGAPVNFCDRPTEFSTAPALLWQHTHAAVVPAFVLGEEGGRYAAFADAPLDFTHGPDPHLDLARNTQLLATHFENVIRQHPGQWFNYVPIWPAAPPPAPPAEPGGGA
ncbi:MAG: lysophospholipid acyltransferase family protein [Chthoniobacteraceae bacterium]